jgi:CBS domain-containing protein
MQSLRVRDLMTSPVFTVAPPTRLPVIKLFMCEKRIHRLPVVNRSRLVGIITLGDVRNAFPSDVPAIGAMEARHALDRVRAADIMRTDVITVTADALLSEAALLMLYHRISGLPVLDGNQLAGIITKSDICRAVVAGDIAFSRQALALQI